MSIKINLNMTQKGKNMKEFGINLKTIRDDLKMTQSEIAEKIGLSLRQYQRYEKEPMNLTLSQILDFSKKLGLNLNNQDKDDEMPSFLLKPKLQTKSFKEFLSLFDEVGNELVLQSFIDKLKHIKTISTD